VVLLSLRGKHTMKDLQNRMPRRLFGLEKEEVTGTCKRLPNWELHTFTR
jgi:hypothetical protein